MTALNSYSLQDWEISNYNLVVVCEAQLTAVLQIYATAQSGQHIAATTALDHAEVTVEMLRNTAYRYLLLQRGITGPST